MCGIAGVLGLSSPDVAVRMSDAMARRGPDDSGVFFDSVTSVSLAHRRLSIIDVSPSGHQPMSYAGGRFHIVFNGEIYNFADLRRELEGLGHRFVSRSDTEVLLAAYAEWGEKCLGRLRGMYAFAIYDKAPREPGDTTLFLARDRFGIKPLYYAHCNGVFLFASELKGLLASGLVERRLDADALWAYVSLGSVPQPLTALRGVKALLPAHVMKVRFDLTVEISRYWDLAESSKAVGREVRGITAPAAAARLRELLDDATRLHMIADVPVGAFLSGGVDSTAVVGLMSRASGKRIRTFSIGFADDRSVPDERHWARLASTRYDTEHTEVALSGSDVAGQFDDIVSAVDQPSLDGTNTFIVSKAASGSVKVALSGLGGDELFAGYPHFRRLSRASRWARWLGASESSLPRALLRHVPGRLLQDGAFIGAARHERYATLRCLAEDQERVSLLSPAVASAGLRTPLSELYLGLMRDDLDDVAQTSYVEVRSYLANTLLRDADAMSMFWSLEVRPVLLDHVVAEFAIALPSALKLAERANKPVLVDAVRDLLPPELLAREKLGFELPLQSWLIGPFRDRARDAFVSPKARALFSEPFLATTLADLGAKRRSSIRVWAYLLLIDWMRSHGIDP